ncbi:hypothetical protein [Rhizobium leguminosarum]|uniref:hypothetical protein n=1 Tax=Rhizobium leguminosarum TaxID=384 RepID=UPI001C91940D|nr:hypothetical protein [Rhizobium leguminosarum]MBY3004087.1 hypothetical protein [Rhizobium leguminosarum]MBY3027496.1 hypothetical protein [Rhizobium leguminosarum]
MKLTVPPSAFHGTAAKINPSPSVWVQQTHFTSGWNFDVELVLERVVDMRPVPDINSIASTAALSFCYA